MCLQLENPEIGCWNRVTWIKSCIKHGGYKFQKWNVYSVQLICVFVCVRTHTAVKIAPRYTSPVIHVLDASRSVVVVRISPLPRWNFCFCWWSIFPFNCFTTDLKWPKMDKIDWADEQFINIIYIVYTQTHTHTHRHIVSFYVNSTYFPPFFFFIFKCKQIFRTVTTLDGGVNQNEA